MPIPSCVRAHIGRSSPSSRSARKSAGCVPMSGPVRNPSSSRRAVEVRGEHGLAVAAGEADSRLRAGQRPPRDGELPGHRAREPGDLVGRDVGDHPRPARGAREELVVDDDDRVEPDALVPDLDDARGRRIVSSRKPIGDATGRQSPEGGDDRLGHDLHGPVRRLARPAQSRERLLLGEPLALHQQPLRPLDDLARLERLGRATRPPRAAPRARRGGPARPRSPAAGRPRGTASRGSRRRRPRPRARRAPPGRTRSASRSGSAARRGSAWPPRCRRASACGRRGSPGRASRPRPARPPPRRRAPRAQTSNPASSSVVRRSSRMIVSSSAIRIRIGGV